MFKRSLGQLKTDIVRANSLVQEANVLAEEMDKQTKFSVTLQIPPANLSPNRKRGAFVSEPAILVRRMNSGSQIWSMEKLENKLIDMRDWYQEFKDNNFTLMDENKNKSDPFYESQENHNLIGVANIFLEVLFHDVKLDYHTPIISQQGEVAGRLQVEISRVAGQFPQDRINESASESSQDSHEDDDMCDPPSNQVTCRISIKQASGLPLYLSNFVFCQYSFWNHDVAVVPATNQEVAAHNQNITFKFDHENDFNVTVNEEFLEHCTDGALSIEVWGHRSVGFSRAKDWEVEQQQAKARSLADRWAELSRKIELWVEIHELNDNGDWAPVDVQCSKDMLTGGVYQLRQGFQRRVLVRVKPVQNSGTLPIICQSIINVSVGCVTVRSKLQKPMDSYQEEDLTVLRDKWSEALGRRRQYLDQQIQKLINKDDKTEQEKEREQSLVNQWVSLTEERNAVLVPAPGSGIPGAPASWDPPLGMEPHVPVLFLDLNADDLTTQSVNDEVPIAGINSILPKEHGNKFYNLQIIQHQDKDICACCSWDSSIHDSPALNRMTEANERVYLILKTTVRLSHPAPMDLVLRKRLALNIYKRQSFTDRLKKLRIGRAESSSLQSGVTYEVVSNIPKASEELEDRESLAQIAATGEDVSASDGETYIEKYTKGVSAVESILTLDRLRQSVAVKELEQVRGPTLSMRKTASVPNFSQVVKDTREHTGLTTSMTMRFFDASLESLLGIGRSESFADLKMGLNSAQSTRESSTNRQKLKNTTTGNSDESPNSSYGAARPTFLNLNINLNSLRLQPTKPSPAASKLAQRMTTLHEEPLIKQICYEEEGEDRFSEPEYADYDFYEPAKKPNLSKMKSSYTVESFIDIDKRPPTNDLGGKYGGSAMAKGKMGSMVSGGGSVGSGTGGGIVKSQNIAAGTPSMSSSTSSGYGSQAVSCSNLTNDDSYSIRSLSVGETPETMSPSNMRNDHTNVKSADCYTPAEINSGFNASAISSEFPKRVNPFLKDVANFDQLNGNQGEEYDDERATELHQMYNNNFKRASEPAILSASSASEMINEEDEGVDEQGGDVEEDEEEETTRTIEEVGEEQMQQQEECNMNETVDEENNSSKLMNDSDVMESSFTTPSKHENIPEWVVVGESVQIRPYNTSGVIAFVGGTHFQGGTWIGVELDTPTGKNDGTVQGIQYFNCKQKHGIFVRVDKLILDKRGRAIRELKRAEKMKAEFAGQKGKPVSANGPRK